MADLKSTLAQINATKGEIAIKRMSLKVGLDLTKVISGIQAVDAALEAKIAAAIQQLGY